MEDLITLGLLKYSMSFSWTEDSDFSRKRKFGTSELYNEESMSSVDDERIIETSSYESLSMIDNCMDVALSCEGSGKPLVPTSQCYPCSCNSVGVQPFPVIFTCSSCSQFYYSVVSSNPWYSLFRHQCSHCATVQIPSIDISLPYNARELDPNIEYFYHETKDEEFLNLEEVSHCREFFLELSEPVLTLLFDDLISQDVDARLIGGKPISWNALVDLRLLALVTHAVRCNVRDHTSSSRTHLCRNTKILLLHIANCRLLNCSFPFCFKCRPVLSFLSMFAAEETTKLKEIQMKKRKVQIID